jgi:hypothetical protein
VTRHSHDITVEADRTGEWSAGFRGAVRRRAIGPAVGKPVGEQLEVFVVGEGAFCPVARSAGGDNVRDVIVAPSGQWDSVLTLKIAPGLPAVVAAVAPDLPEESPHRRVESWHRLAVDWCPIARQLRRDDIGQDYSGPTELDSSHLAFRVPLGVLASTVLPSTQVVAACRVPENVVEHLVMAEDPPSPRREIRRPFLLADDLDLPPEVTVVTA